jgi:predicted membrane protein
MTGSRSTQLRLTSLLAALAIVLAMFVLVQQPADAAPATGSVAAAVALVGGDDAAQIINFGQIVCPILFAVRNAFATSPFFSFIDAILGSLLRGFGCAPS